MLKGGGLKAWAIRAEVFETATEMTHQLGSYADPVYDLTEPRSPKTKALHQTYNFGVRIRFKLGDSAGEKGEISGLLPEDVFPTSLI